jgi:hypothetical protein
MPKVGLARFCGRSEMCPTNHRMFVCWSWSLLQIGKIGHSIGDRCDRDHTARSGLRISWVLGRNLHVRAPRVRRGVRRAVAFCCSQSEAASRAGISLLPRKPAAQASKGRRLAYVIRSGRPFAPILGLQPSGCAGAEGQFEHRTGQSGSSSNWRGFHRARGAFD